jgi:hypothetical protein
MTDESDSPQRDGRRPLQIGLSTMLGVTAAAAALFGVLRWLGVGAEAGLLVLVLLLVSVPAALALVAVIAAQGSDDEEDR